MNYNYNYNNEFYFIIKNKIEMYFISNYSIIIFKKLYRIKEFKINYEVRKKINIIYPYGSIN